MDEPSVSPHRVTQSLAFTFPILKELGGARHGGDSLSENLVPASWLLSVYPTKPTPEVPFTPLRIAV